MSDLTRVQLVRLNIPGKTGTGALPKLPVVSRYLSEIAFHCHPAEKVEPTVLAQ